MIEYGIGNAERRAGSQQSKLERLVARTARLSPRRPAPPRELTYAGGVLSWKAPTDTSLVTHYRVYANSDSDVSLARDVPVGQTYLADNLSASRVFVSSFNSFTGQESERVPLQATIDPGTNPIRVAYSLENAAADLSVYFAGAVSRTLNEKLGESVSVLDFGAKGDAREVFDGGISVGSANLNSATAAFVITDVGKYCSVEGAGAAGATLHTTILQVTSATVAVLANTAGTGVASGATVYIATDDRPAFILAHDAIQARGDRLLIPEGRYFLSDFWALSKTLTIEGSGDGFDETKAGSVLEFREGKTGITLLNNNAERSVLRYVTISSRSIAAGTDDGIQNQSNGCIFQQITVRGFGRRGFSCDTTSQGNANSTSFTHCRAFLNFSHGWYLTGLDSNQIRLSHCSASRNRGYGLYSSSQAPTQFTFSNTYDTLHTETNWLGAIYENGSDGIYINPYCEPDGPTGVCTTTGTAVARVSGIEFSTDWALGDKINIRINGVEYLVASVTDTNNLVLATTAGNQTNVSYMPRVNQLAKFGPDAQYSQWMTGTPFLNAPKFIGTDNGTHIITQLGRFKNRLAVRGVVPKLLIEDSTPVTTGTCNTSGTAVTWVSGGQFTAAMKGSWITINAVGYRITAVGGATSLTIALTAGTQSGVAFSIALPRTYRIDSGAYSSGALGIIDDNVPENILVYQPATGWFALKDFTLAYNVPVFRLQDETPTTGKVFSLRSGFYGASVLSVHNDTDSHDLLIYDPGTQRWFALKDFQFNGQIKFLATSSIINGAGSPEGVVVANIGSLYLRNNGASGTALYVKIASDGLNTGWATVPNAPIYSGAGSPEGVVTASEGAIYLRTGASAVGFSLYYKESGTGNTGWIRRDAFASDFAGITTAEYEARAHLGAKQLQLQKNGSDGTDEGSVKYTTGGELELRGGTGSGGAGRIVAVGKFKTTDKIRPDYLTASTVPYADANKDLVSSAVTPTELGYVAGVTSAIQTQLNGKAPDSGVSGTFSYTKVGATVNGSLTFTNGRLTGQVEPT